MLGFKVLINPAQDDLYDYTEVVRSRLHDLLEKTTIGLNSPGSFNCSVIHRTGKFQAELIKIHPNEKVPLHWHPGVDSIDFFLNGSVDMVVGHIRINRCPKRIGIRIDQHVVHGGVVGPNGLTYISCQKWNSFPSHIAMAWGGEAVTDDHKRILDALESVR